MVGQWQKQGELLPEMIKLLHLKTKQKNFLIKKERNM